MEPARAAVGSAPAALPGPGAAPLRVGAMLALSAAALATALAPTYLSPDSVHYLDVARSLADGLGPVSRHLHLGSPTVPAATGLWPSGYPAALALLSLLGLDAAHAPSVLNAGALVLLGLSLWWLARLGDLPAWLATAAAAAALAHPALRHVLSHTWSDPLFVALTAATLALLAHALVHRRPALALAAGLAAGLAFTVRYTGLFLVGYVLTATVACGLAQRWSARRHLSHAGLLLVGPLLTAPLAVWANLTAYGRPFGLPRVPVPDLSAALLVRLRELLAGLEALPAGGGVLLLVAALLLSRLEDGGAVASPKAGAPSAPRQLVTLLLAGWIPWYATALFASVAAIITDPTDQRLLSPIAPVLLLLAFLLAAPAVARLRLGPALATAGLLLALQGHVDAAWQRHLDPPMLETAPGLVALARREASPDTLFVASRGWELRLAAGVTVLEDGYPDMAPLEAGAVFRFLSGPGRDFRRVELVFQPEGTVPTERIPAFLAAAAHTGWIRQAITDLGSATVVGLIRAGPPGLLTRR
jgi:hypothetical protein